MTVGIRPTVACSWSMLCIALRGLSLLFLTALFFFFALPALPALLRNDDGNGLTLCSICVVCPAGCDPYTSFPPHPPGHCGICSTCTHARTHTHAHTRLSSPSQGRRTRQHCVSRMQHSPKRGNTPTKGSFPRGTTTPTHHTCTLTLTLTQFYARPPTRGSQVLLIGGATPKRDGIGGANGRLSAGCDWALWLVALNPSALSKAVPASSTSTPPCVPQYPAAGSTPSTACAVHSRVQDSTLCSLGVCWTRPRPSQARPPPPRKPSLTTLLNRFFIVVC